VGGLQVEQNPEAVEVPLDSIERRVPLLKGHLLEELRLSRRLGPGREGRDPKRSSRLDECGNGCTIHGFRVDSFQSPDITY
jgi:hypothetical protein